MASTETQSGVFQRHRGPHGQVFVRGVESFRWDAQDAYLFDIDGTLLRCRDRIHVDSFLSSVRSVMGRELALEGVTLSGNTDPGILRDAFRLVQLDEAHWQPHLENILQKMRDDVAARRSEMKIDKMPGVDEVLKHLRDKGAAIGVATGNLESIGWLKIEILGLRHWFTFGGFSDRHHSRVDMIAHAADRARSQRGPNATVCVVGDTPADIAAAHANNLPAIAVATGNYSFEQLMQHQPEACATNFLALLNAPGPPAAHQ